jgi:regulator of protease activity HflC (stomatin/prohibitin superfamily)
MEILALVAAAGVAALATSLRILREYDRAVVFRLGRVRPVRGPGLVFLVPFGIERMERVSLRIIAMDIPPQDVITRDNVSVKVNAVLYFRVADPMKAILEIEDFLFATSQLAQTTLRSVIGQAELDELLAEREKFNQILRDIIDEGTDAWGIDVTGVEVKDVDLPQEMKRAIARQAEAERERRAKVINAEGELQAAVNLRKAAKLLSEQPASLQLRFLQTASEIAAENNSTTLFPLPLDFGPFVRWLGRDRAETDTELDEEAETELEALAGAETAGSLPSGLDEAVRKRLGRAAEREDREADEALAPSRRSRESDAGES